MSETFIAHIINFVALIVVIATFFYSKNKDKRNEEKRITTIEVRVSTIESQMKSFETKIDNIEDVLSELQTTISKIYVSLDNINDLYDLIRNIDKVTSNTSGLLAEQKVKIFNSEKQIDKIFEMLNKHNDLHLDDAKRSKSK